MTSERHKDVIRGIWAAMNSRALDDLDDLIAADMVRHCPATPQVQVRSLAAFKEFLRGFEASFPDNVQVLEHLVAEGDRVAVWSTFEGTHQGAFGSLPASGRTVRFEFAAVLRLLDGKVAEWWVTWDNMGVLAQLGALPES